VHAKGLSRFLRFVVERSVEGRPSEIKEYVIGVEVFDRGTSFDPRLDTVVRVEARRLRSKLREYYETEGRPDAVRIDVPKGSYVPVFQNQRLGAAPSRAVSVPAGTSPNSVGVAVLPFVNLARDEENEFFSDGLTEELINALAAVPGLRVTSRTSVFAFKKKLADIREIGERLRVQMIVEGSVRKTAERLRITVQLINVSDDSHVWSDSYDREMKDIFELQNEITQAILRALRPHFLGGNTWAR
jgi:serine/threonine-protein kinase